MKIDAKVQKHIALKLGFEVDLAYSLGEAIALIEENDYFCAVVDYVLPDANDGEAIPFTIGAEIPTIVMTEIRFSNLESLFESIYLVDINNGNFIKKVDFYYL